MKSPIIFGSHFFYREDNGWLTVYNLELTEEHLRFLSDPEAQRTGEMIARACHKVPEKIEVIGLWYAYKGHMGKAPIDPKEFVEVTIAKKKTRIRLPELWVKYLPDITESTGEAMSADGWFPLFMGSNICSQAKLEIFEKIRLQVSDKKPLGVWILEQECERNKEPKPKSDPYFPFSYENSTVAAAIEVKIFDKKKNLDIPFSPWATAPKQTGNTMEQRRGPGRTPTIDLNTPENARIVNLMRSGTTKVAEIIKTLGLNYEKDREHVRHVIKMAKNAP